jgi:hypothetical protein
MGPTERKSKANYGQHLSMIGEQPCCTKCCMALLTAHFQRTNFDFVLRVAATARRSVLRQSARLHCSERMQRSLASLDRIALA